MGNRDGVENNPRGKRAKLEVRQRALTWIGAANARVFDAFAGNGAMWRDVWRGAADYAGCDVRAIYDLDRPLFHHDAERVMRAIDLNAFNVFDLDAFGSPWPVAWVLSQRRQLGAGEKVAIITTDGAKLNARFGQVERCFAYLTGRKRDDSSAHAAWGQLTVTALQRSAELMGARAEWTDVRDHYGPSKCQVYAATGLVGLAASAAGAGVDLGGKPETVVAGGEVAETPDAPVAPPERDGEPVAVLPVAAAMSADAPLPAPA